MSNKNNKNTNVKELRFRRFNISKMTDDAVVLLIGKRGSGKSYLARDILYQKRHFPVGRVVSGTEYVNEYYSHFIPRLLIASEHNDNIIQNIMDRSQLIKKKNNKIIRKGGKESDLMNRSSFIVYDDALDDAGRWKKSKQIKSLFFNGRHFSIFFLLIMQYPLGIGPSLRANVDYIFLLRATSHQIKRRLYECYAGMFDNYDDFSQAFNALTENYGCMVINNKTTSMNLTDQVFYYHAAKTPDFRMCEEKYWTDSERAFDNDTESEEEVEINDNIENVVDTKKGQLHIIQEF